MDEKLIERIVDSTKGMRQAFYFSLIFSLLTIYLLTNSGPKSTPESTAIKTETTGRLLVLEPVLELNKGLQINPAVIHSYFKFLEPLVAIDSAAEQAIVGADFRDPKWLSLNPVDRDLSRSIRDSVQFLDDGIETHFQSDLSDLPVPNIRDYLSWFVWPEKDFSSVNAILSLKASHRVALSLGQELPEKVAWPVSLYLHEFAGSSSNSGLTNLFKAARDGDFSETIASIVYLESFCNDNEIEYCSPHRIQAELDRGVFNIRKSDDSEMIEISFFPSGVETALIIHLAPFLLLGSVYLQLSHQHRRIMIVEGLSSESQWNPLLDFPWLMTNSLVFDRASKHTHLLFRGVVRLMIVIGLVLPAAAQLYVLAVSSIEFYESGASGWWVLAHLVAFVLTTAAVVSLVTDTDTTNILPSLEASNVGVSNESEGEPDRR